MRKYMMMIFLIRGLYALKAIENEERRRKIFKLRYVTRFGKLTNINILKVSYKNLIYDFLNEWKLFTTISVEKLSYFESLFNSEYLY